MNWFIATLTILAINQFISNQFGRCIGRTIQGANGMPRVIAKHDGKNIIVPYNVGHLLRCLIATHGTKPLLHEFSPFSHIFQASQALFQACTLSFLVHSLAAISPHPTNIPATLRCQPDYHA